MILNRTKAGNVKDLNMKLLYMTTMKRLIPLLSVILLLNACEQRLPEFEDYEYTAVYFPHQYPIRTLSLGEEEYDNSLDKELKFHIAPNIGGMYTNTESWTVDFEVADTLAHHIENIGGDTLLPLPESYYTLTPSGQVVIPPGSFKGMIEVQLTEAFLQDTLAHGNHYVIPLRITGTSADSILRGLPSGVNPNPDPRKASEWAIPPKDYVLFGIKYVNQYHGTYLHRGMNIMYDNNNDPVDTAIYREIYIVDDELWKLYTKGTNVVHTDGIANYRGGVYMMKLTFSESGEIAVDSISGSTFAPTGTGTYVKGGGTWGGEPRDVIYLSYSFSQGDTLTHVVNDTLVYRNRGIRFETFTPVMSY
jgi:hypothetical protein